MTGLFFARRFHLVIESDPPCQTGLVDKPLREWAGRWATLGRRERQVADLLAQGLTDRAISRLMSISSATVRSHVVHARTKLDIPSRRQFVEWARGR